MKNVRLPKPLLFLLSLAPAILLSNCSRSDKPAETLPPQCSVVQAADLNELSSRFAAPGIKNRAWVYWFFMDGNLSREGITADLEAMARAGIGGAIWMEVNVGVPRGSVDFMSPEWVELFAHACRETERLGISLSLISGPGWTGSGGPWVSAPDAMHFLVSDTVSVRGGAPVELQLPRPRPREPYFGMNNLTPSLRQQRADYYQEMFVLAYPRNTAEGRIDDIDRKASYARHPYSSDPKAKPYLPMRSSYPALPEGAALASESCIDLTELTSPEGILRWDAPEGEWIIYRFGQTVTGANTRPAPLPGVGFESSKLDTAALNRHLDAYIGTLMRAAGIKPGYRAAGWNMLHIDSWEMGPENWSTEFRQEFIARRGYDPKPYLPAMAGQVVNDLETSERFLWDLRLTAQELILQNHAGHLRNYAHRNGFGLSIEPYDMSPNNDIALGAVADVPMCETWEVDDHFNTAFSCIEAVSAANLKARPIVAAEAFTSHTAKFWQLHPGNMKNQADWAFCIGINRLAFHRYAHQPWMDRYPGMTMGPYGMNYERTQTWWELSQAWHTYLARCQYLLRQGRGVADILFLTPEGAPMAFMPPESALEGSDRLPDKRGYNFDGCDPGSLMNACVRDGKIRFPGGMEYSILVLPTEATMTPGMLRKVKSLLRAGATVMGHAPEKSPGLSNYPHSDSEVLALVSDIWGDTQAGSSRKVGRGTLIHPADADTLDRRLSVRGFMPPYVRYEAISAALASAGIAPDFESSLPLRYIHRKAAAAEIYMVSNPSDRAVSAVCSFRADGNVSLWDAVSGAIAPATAETTADGRSQLTLELEPHGSVFVLFSQEEPAGVCTTPTLTPTLREMQTFAGPWQVTFQSGRGAPASATFPALSDWSLNADEGIRYFSGIADYTTSFWLEEPELETSVPIVLDLGRVEVMARVKINGRVVTELWHAPYRCNVKPYLEAGWNSLTVSVANEWPNRLAGDQRLPETQRLTFTTHSPITRDFELLPSGLLGPVTLNWAR